MPNNIINNKSYTLLTYFEKLFKCGFLIRSLVTRELKAKYSRTILGVGWLLIQPLVLVAIYTIFFQKIIKLDSDGISYPSFVITGLVLWYLFTGIISKCTTSLIESAELINKVSFPRIIILFSKIIPVIMECFVLLILAIIVLFISGTKLNYFAFTSIFYFIQTTIFSFSLGMIFSVIVLRNRDFVYGIPFLFNIGIWLTPVFYSVTIVPYEYRNFLRYANPLSLSMEGLRGGLFQSQGISFASIILFFCTCVLLFISFFIFVKFEKRIVENL